MKLRQLEFIVEIAKGMNVSEAARKLHTSQPGVSRYVALLEEELGVKIFVRERKRIVRLTVPGQALVQAASRALAEVENVERIAKRFRLGTFADFTVATAHTHARYTLPSVIQQFTARYPDVRLTLRQGFLSEAVKWVVDGQADVFVTTTPRELHPELTVVPCHQLYRVVLTQASHPLSRKRWISLQDICAYPIITYEHGFSARAAITGAFEQNGLKPNIVLSATDAEVMKAYVRSGLGIAIVANVVYEKAIDSDLSALSARHLFGSSTVVVGFRSGGYLANYITQFFKLLQKRAKRV